MKNLAIITFVFCISVFAASIDGKWISEMEVGDADGKTYTLTSTFVLQSDSGSLTGTAVQTSEAPWAKDINGRTFEISDGKIRAWRDYFDMNQFTSRMG